MEAQAEENGNYRFKLGPVEKWIVGLGATAIVVVAGWAASSVNTQLQDTTAKLNTLITQQAVTNQQLMNLSTQMADIPQLRTQMTELKVRVDRHDEDLKELRNTRGLR